MNKPKYLWLLAVMLLGGCSIGSTQVPEDHYYRLPDASSGTGRAAVTIASVRVSGMLHERAMLYVNAASPLEVKRFYYHHWADIPENLVGQYMQAWFGESNPAHAAALNVFINQFELLKEDGNNRVIVDLSVDSQDKHYHFHQETPVQGTAMTDVAKAFGAALGQILQQLNQALSQP